MGNDKLEKLKLENGWIGLTPEKKDVLKGFVGCISFSDDASHLQLDPNNWGHVYWWQEDEDAEEFMDNERDMIEQFAKFENVSIKDAVDILFEQSKGQ